MRFLTDDSGQSFNKDKRRSGLSSSSGGTANVIKIIRTIKERDMLPCIIFSFSRKECEAYASTLKDVDFNDGNGFYILKIFTINSNYRG